MNSTAKVIPEILTDNSVVYNVWRDGEIVSAPPSQSEAEQIAAQLNELAKRKFVRISESKVVKGNWKIELDDVAMTALVSIVRLYGPAGGWEGSDQDIHDGGVRLAEAIERVW